MNRKLTMDDARSLENVLVVDDDPDFLERLSCELQSAGGLKIQAANNLTEAVDSLTKNTFQLIVSDWAIHSSTGPEVLQTADRLLKKSGHKIPVLFISGDDRRALTKGIQPLMNFEPVSFLLKGAGTSRISQTVQSILSLKRRPNSGTQ